MHNGVLGHSQQASEQTLSPLTHWCRGQWGRCCFDHSVASQSQYYSLSVLSVLSTACTLQPCVQSKRRGLRCPSPSETSFSFLCEHLKIYTRRNGSKVKVDSWIDNLPDMVIDDGLFYFQATSTTPRHMSRNNSLIHISELEKKFDGLRCSSPGDSYVSFTHLEGLIKHDWGGYSSVFFIFVS